MIMAHKQTIKKSEARILIFIQNVDITMCYPAQIGLKLGIDSAYMSRLIATMKEKNWIKIQRTRSNKSIIQIAYKCPTTEELIEAKK